MLAIRLQRVGRKKQAIYRVVVSEKTKDMYGNHLEILGQYNPHNKEVMLKEDRIKHWISVGAQASDTVSNLLIKEGILEGDKKKSVSISKKRTAKKDKVNGEAREGDLGQAAKPEEKKEEPPAPVEEVKKDEPKEEVNPSADGEETK